MCNEVIELLALSGKLLAQVSRILRLEQRNNVICERLIASRCDMDTAFCARAEHAMVKFVWVLVSSLLAHALELVALDMVVTRTLNIILVFLQQAEALSVSRLAALLVVAPLDIISQRHGGEKSIPNLHCMIA